MLIFLCMMFCPALECCEEASYHLVIMQARRRQRHELEEMGSLVGKHPTLVWAP